MIIIYGWKRNVKREKHLGKEHCTNCSHDEDLFLAKETFKIHILGIPVFMKTKRRFVMCNNCGVVEELNKSEYKSKLNEV